MFQYNRKYNKIKLIKKNKLKSINDLYLNK